MRSENEDYLDRLLNAVQEKDAIEPSASGMPDLEEEVNSFDAMDLWNRTGGHHEQSAGHHNRKSRVKSEEEFLDEFERELQEIDTNELISEFELEIESQEAAKSEGRDTAFSFEGLDKAMMAANNQEDDWKENEVIKDNDAENETIKEMGSEPLKESVKEMGSEPLKESVKEMGNESLNEQEANENDLLSNLNGLMEETIEEETSENTQDGQDKASKDGKDATEIDMNSDEDIIAMLDGLADDEDLADIGQMLKADENHETISGSEDLAGEVAESLASLGFEIDPGDMEEVAKIKDVSQIVPEKIYEYHEKKGTSKGGFLQKLMNLFFGPDEEENDKSQVQESIPEEDLSGISEENLDILRSLEGGVSESKAVEKEDPKAKKKAEKEAKKKEAKKQKAIKAKEKEAAKKAKAANKKPKVKKPKVKDNTPPLPKLPVFLILIMCVSIAAAIFYIGNGIHYRTELKNSEDYYVQGRYLEAYSKVSGLNLKESDEKYGKKLQILASMDELNRSYDTLIKADRQELALDCLIRMVGRFDKVMKKADELECLAELSAIEQRAEKILKKEYKVTYNEAVKLYKIRSRIKYSIQLVTILEEAGRN